MKTMIAIRKKRKMMMTKTTRTSTTAYRSGQMPPNCTS